MTVITGDVRDIGMSPLSGALIATSVEFRTSGDFVVAPESRSWPIVAGAVSVDLLPGPTRITIQVGSHARDNFDVIVPDEPTTLAQLVEDALPWTPAVVSEVAAHRAAAEAAAARAEDAASSFGLTASASTLPAGSSATVDVTGDGPAYGLVFGVPAGVQGDPGDPGPEGPQGPPGDVGTHTHPVSDIEATGTASAATVLFGDGRWDVPPTGGGGGSTDASLLTGALTGQVDASAAMVESDLSFPGGPGVTNNTVAGWVSTLYYMVHLAVGGLDSKADVDHTHTAADVGAVANAGGVTGIAVVTDLPPTGVAGTIYFTEEA